MRTASVAISRGGADLARRVSSFLDDCDVYVKKEWAMARENSFDNLAQLMEDIFFEYRALVLIMAAGIAVRVTAPHLKDKTTDPAVIVIDDSGSFAISLLSGHIGGANRITKMIADEIGAVPVITTASDVKGLMAVDTIAEKCEAVIDNMEDAKYITSMLVNNKKVSFLTEYDIKVPGYLAHDIDSANGLIICTHEKNVACDKPHAKIIPKNITIGIGYKKEKTAGELIDFINKQLSLLNIDKRSVKTIGTVDIKKNDGIMSEVAVYFKLKETYFSKEEIAEVEDRFSFSRIVKDNIGVGSVSEPCAFLSSNKKGRLISGKSASNGMTCAIWQEDLERDVLYG